MRVATRSVVGLLGLGLGLVFGCNGGGGGGNPAGALVSKLDACGLLSDGELPMVDGADVDPELACYFECAVQASCPELTDLFCSPGDVMPSAALEACYMDCVGDTEGGGGTYSCADGSTIPDDWVCDGEPDCDSEDDEVGCVEFTCADGSEMIPETWVCDGGQDCEDGSDELDCPGFVACTGGGSIPQEYVCDGEPDCESGSDELGCPAYNCANGQQVVGGVRCNLNEECEDGSDEAGCAQLVCPMTP